MSPVEYLRPILVLAMLGYASFKDLKTRELTTSSGWSSAPLASP